MKEKNGTNKMADVVHATEETERRKLRETQAVGSTNSFLFLNLRHFHFSRKIKYKTSEVQANPAKKARELEPSEENLWVISEILKHFQNSPAKKRPEFWFSHDKTQSEDF
jgi:hypothetical protein